jgi:hypothetical protein
MHYVFNTPRSPPPDALVLRLIDQQHYLVSFERELPAPKLTLLFRYQTQNCSVVQRIGKSPLFFRPRIIFCFLVCLTKRLLLLLPHVCIKVKVKNLSIVSKMVACYKTKHTPSFCVTLSGRQSCMNWFTFHIPGSWLLSPRSEYSPHTGIYWPRFETCITYGVSTNAVTASVAITHRNRNLVHTFLPVAWSRLWQFAVFYFTVCCVLSNVMETIGDDSYFVLRIRLPPESSVRFRWLD